MKIKVSTHDNDSFKDAKVQLSFTNRNLSLSVGEKQAEVEISDEQNRLRQQYGRFNVHIETEKESFKNDDGQTVVPLTFIFSTSNPSVNPLNQQERTFQVELSHTKPSVELYYPRTLQSYLSPVQSDDESISGVGSSQLLTISGLKGDSVENKVTIFYTVTEPTELIFRAVFNDNSILNEERYLVTHITPLV